MYFAAKGPSIVVFRLFARSPFARSIAGATAPATSSEGAVFTPSKSPPAVTVSGGWIFVRTTLPVAASTTMSTHPNAAPHEPDSMMAIPATSCAMFLCVCPATIACTAPGGSFRATSKISDVASQLDRSVGTSTFAQWPPACAATTTTFAPRARSAFASAAIASASCTSETPTTFAAIVVVRVDIVETPMIPTETPRFVTSAEGTTLGQSRGCPSSSKFAASTGKDPFACAARALSAPRASLSGPSLASLRTVDASPTGP